MMNDARGFRKLVILGDSLTAGYGLAKSQAYPARCEAKLDTFGIKARLENAGINGDTTGGGAYRLDPLLRAKPEFLAIALGANDMLRRYPIDEIRGNLERIIARAKGAGAKPLLFGMAAVPFYGLDYMEAFNDLYPALAERHAIPLLPFLLEGVALRAEFNFADGLHPNAAGHECIARTVVRFLKPLLEAPVDACAAAEPAEAVLLGS